MIEIVYEENKNETQNMGRMKYELPKNIRQVGNAPGNFKIYIEDYVMTYLRRIAAPGNSSCRGAILLGKLYEDNGNRIMFISGAVDAQNLEFDISAVRFGDGVWSGLYSEINKYFDDLSVVGWFLSRMGFSTAINEQMKKLHRENFGGSDKVLFLMDSLECEEAFYYYEHGNFMREKGYYIYYVRNEKMQNYIISRKNGSDEEKNQNTLINDRTVVDNFRKKESQREAQERGHFGAAALSFVAVCALSLVVLWYTSPESVDRLGDMITGENGGEVQVFMNSGSDTAARDESLDVAEPGAAEKDSTNGTAVVKEGSDEESGDVDAREAGEASATVDAGKTDEPAGEGNLSAASDTGNADVEASAESSSQAAADSGETASVYADGQDNSQSESTNESTNESSNGSAIGSYGEYTVATGDTLVSISIQMYGSQNYAGDIARANNMSTDEPIYEGEKLIIPYIE